MRIDYLEVTKIVAASLILITIFGGALYYSQIRPTRAQPNRLVIITPSQLKSGQEEILKIGAVDDKGEFMRTRNDLVEVSILTHANASIGIKGESGVIWSEQLHGHLNDGIMEILIKGGGVETVTVTVRQLEGETPLERAVSLLYVGME